MYNIQNSDYKGIIYASKKEKLTIFLFINTTFNLDHCYKILNIFIENFEKIELQFIPRTKIYENCCIWFLLRFILVQNPFLIIFDGKSSCLCDFIILSSTPCSSWLILK